MAQETIFSKITIGRRGKRTKTNHKEGYLIFYYKDKEEK